MRLIEADERQVPPRVCIPQLAQLVTVRSAALKDFLSSGGDDAIRTTGLPYRRVAS
jgi:hypothetical protein